MCVVTFAKLRLSNHVLPEQLVNLRELCPDCTHFMAGDVVLLYKFT